MANKSLDSTGNVINPAKEDGNLANVKSNTDKLDVNLSTRASEVTAAGIKTQTDKLTFDVSNNLKVTSVVTPADDFERILRGEFKNTEQVLRDVPSTTYASASEYTGVALAAALPTDPTWSIVRVLFDANGNESKKSIKTSVAWSNRASLVW